jgi:aryl-alcohol dehydrogenase-like predicted oxidoreductase
VVNKEASMHEQGRWNPNRRELIGAGLGVAAAGALAGAAGAAHARGRAPSDLITRPIPGTRERVPAIGLGSFITFDTLPGASREHIREVIQRHWRAGGRVFDVSPLYGSSEVNLGEAARAMRITDRMFLANKVWSTGEYAWDDSHAERNLQRSIERLSRHRPIDVVQCHSLTVVEVMVPLLRAWKREGRIRYVGVTHHEPIYFDALAEWVERGVVDFVQVHYSIHTRAAEQRVIPAAAQRNVAVLVNMPLEKARLHKVVEGRALPAFARDFGIASWAEFFLKWVISNPAVTCALPATSNPEHLSENVAALRGPLPDPDMRARMVRHMESIPGFDRIAQMPWYPDKAYRGLVTQAQAKLLARAG